MISANVHAGTVSLSDAQHVALNFFKVTTNANATLTATLKYTKTGANNTADFYVFDISPAMGFVIVAGDDNVIPILGYSTKGNFHTDFNRIGLNHWINKTSANIHLALQHNAMADARIQGQWTTYRQGQNPFVLRSSTVSPLCTTTWDQENTNNFPPPYIYNLFCPFNAVDTQRCLTGCVATSMAQIMKYWNYPATGMGSYTYIDDTLHGYSANYGTLSSNFAAHSYQWQLMPTMLTGSEPLAQDSAVDQLMYDCAVSVGMDFGDDNQGGSGAEALLVNELQFGDSICSQYAFVKYFSYNADTIQGILQSNYNDSTWTLVIEHDLNMGRPILYEGNDSTQGGHAWVCDGYDASNNLHMNWGWSGFDDGYFAVNNLTTSGNYNPILNDAALIGILPKSVTAGVTSVGEEISFNMYPNPAASQVILITTEINGSTWAVKNIMGQALISKNVESAQTRLDLSSLAAGVYFVELRAGEKTSVKKLVISK